MDIKRIILSYLDANCYIISIGKKCLIVDPGWDKDVIIREVKDKKVLGILVTHYHPDHVGALEDIIKESIEAKKELKKMQNEQNEDMSGSGAICVVF